MANDPFKTAQPVAKKLKVLLYGATGTGKTIAATSFPRPAYIDTEGGTHLYRGRKGFEHIKWLDEKTLTGIEQAIAFIAQDGGKTYDTLVIDPITVVYDVLKEAMSRTAKNNELGFRDWAKINNRMNALYTALTNLPVHVVGVCREADIYEKVNGEMQRAGVKPDADKDVRYIFDFEIRMLPDHTGVVGKSRGFTLGENGRMRDVHWGAFEPVANVLLVGETQKVEDKDSAAQREAEAGEEPVIDPKTAKGRAIQWANKNRFDAAGIDMPDDENNEVAWKTWCEAVKAKAS